MNSNRDREQQTANQESTDNPPGRVPGLSITRHDFIRRFVIGTAAVGLSGWAIREAIRRLPEGENSGGNGQNRGKNGDEGRDRNRAGELDRLLNREFATLDRDLKVTWQSADRSFGRIQNQFERSLLEQGGRFSDEKITRWNISQLLVLMVRDHFDDEGRAEAWFEENLNPYLVPAIDAYERGITATAAEFNREVTQTIDGFNRGVFAVLNQSEVVPDNAVFREDLLERIQSVFVERGIFSTAGPSVGLTVMIGGIFVFSSAVLIKKISQQMRRATLRILRPVAGRAIARLGASGASGVAPPLAVIVAAVGAIWTGWDIYWLRGKTQKAFMAGLTESIAASDSALEEEVKMPLKKVAVDIQQSRSALKKAILANVDEKFRPV